eukprot:8422091-Alexandrium_andersonii.AAC.1
MLSACPPGWDLSTVYFDLLHNLWIGPARNVVGECFRVLLAMNWFGHYAAVDDALRRAHLLFKERGANITCGAVPQEGVSCGGEVAGWVGGLAAPLQ